MVIDDHTLVREAVCRMIDSEPDLHVVGQAGSLTEGRVLLQQQPFHVLVIDVSMPDGSGLTLARAAREASPRLGIVVLTMHNDDETLLEALDLGASALVLKSAPSEEVIAAVRRAAAAPDAFMATGLAEALRRRSSSDKPKLTPRQRTFLTAAWAHRGTPWEGLIPDPTPEEIRAGLIAAAKPELDDPEE